jgi:hypothetical protein
MVKGERMTENRDNNAKEQFTIRMIGLQQGASQEKLIASLQRLFKKKTPEEIQNALNRLPLVLSRTARKSQALKIKEFLESVGAFVELTDTSPVKGRGGAGLERAEDKNDAAPSKGDQPPMGEERRTKPRVHTGIKLHPMGIGELLDRSFRMMREYFWLFFLIVLIPQGIWFLVGKVIQPLLGGMEGREASMALGVGFGISAMLAFVVFIILQFWAQGALIHAVSETYLGHNTSVAGSYGAMRRILGRLLGTLILFSILVMLVPAFAGMFMAIFIPLLLSMGFGNVTIGFLVFFVVVVVVWFFFRLFLNWLMVDKVVVLEGKGWMKALKRSTELMKGRTEPGFWKSNKMKAGLILLLGFLIALGIQLIFQIPGVIFSVILKGSLVVRTVIEILNIVGTTLATSFTATAMILYYYDIRLRKEGFDLKMMAENL